MIGGGLVPVKWMAPESTLHQVSTTKSDAWSFGILLWEIVTLADTPYEGIAVDVLVEQYRQGGALVMEKPDHCPDDVYGVMRECWSFNPAVRPAWWALVSKLRKICTGNATVLPLFHI
jgi:insulin-like growth factor 1 receptor